MFRRGVNRAAIATVVDQFLLVRPAQQQRLSLGSASCLTASYACGPTQQYCLLVLVYISTWRRSVYRSCKNFIFERWGLLLCMMWCLGKGLARRELSGCSHTDKYGYHAAMRASCRSVFVRGNCLPCVVLCCTAGLGWGVLAILVSVPVFLCLCLCVCVCVSLRLVIVLLVATDLVRIIWLFMLVHTVGAHLSCVQRILKYCTACHRHHNNHVGVRSHLGLAAGDAAIGQNL